MHAGYVKSEYEESEYEKCKESACILNYVVVDMKAMYILALSRHTNDRATIIRPGLLNS